MDRDTIALIMAWGIGVVAFFALWAILLRLIKRISEKRQPKETVQKDLENEGKDSVNPTDA